MLNLIFRMVIIIVNINIMIMMVKRQACHNKCGNYPNGGIHHMLGGRVSPHHYNHHHHLHYRPLFCHCSFQISPIMATGANETIFLLSFYFLLTSSDSFLSSSLFFSLYLQYAIWEKLGAILNLCVANIQQETRRFNFQASR